MFRTIGAGVALLAGLCGCHQLGLNHDVRRVIDKPVELPKLAPASVEAAARIDEVGRELLAATPLGIPDVAFHTVGSAEPEIFHHDSNTLYVTEGLVNQCKTDAQLSAVLAAEIGHMTAEFRRTTRKAHPDPIPTAALSTPLDRTTGIDPGQELYLAQFEKHARKPAEKLSWPTVDPNTIADELLRNAGVEKTAVAEVKPLLKAAGRNHQIAGQFKGSGPAPRWSN